VRLLVPQNLLDAFIQVKKANESFQLD
jgi:hypothetical protein